MFESLVLLATASRVQPTLVWLWVIPPVPALLEALVLAVLCQAGVATLKRMTKPSLRRVVLSTLSAGWTRRFRGSRYWAQPVGELEEILGDLREKVAKGKYERFEDFAFLLLQASIAIVGCLLLGAWNTGRSYLLRKLRIRLR